jgi:hypothetical protein
MALTILGQTRDLRTSTPVVYAQAPIAEYLRILGPSFDDFPQQRRRERYKAYDRMREDIKKGALLPSITLAIKPELVDSLLPAIETNDLDALMKLLAIPGQTHILDGLQRTHILRELANEPFQFLPEQSVLLEFWLERDVRHLSYRMIVLNAGQKPMSLRHQIEVLFATIRTEIEKRIEGLELYTEREQTRLRKAKKYALDRVALAYQCFLSKTPQTERENLIAQQMFDGVILETSEEGLAGSFDRFIEYLANYAKLDEQGCRIYAKEQTDQPESSIPTGANWFGSEAVMCSFFAAAAQVSQMTHGESRMKKSLEALLEKLYASAEQDDPLGLETYNQILNGFNRRKVNIGFETKQLLTTGFKQFFRDEGETSLGQSWQDASV